MKRQEEMALGVEKPSEDSELTEQMADEFSSLSPRQQAALHALLTTSTMEEAAKSANMSTVTLWRIKKDPLFRALYDKVRREIARQAMDAMLRHAPAAVQRMIELAGDKSTPAATQLAALKFIISSAKESLGIEEVIERLSDLEFFVKYKMAKDK